MNRIPGLCEFVKNDAYRSAMGLPKELTEHYELLASGEFHCNYLFEHPSTGEKYLLRVNLGSQMHLEHQIEYEASALSLIHSSRRTPRVYYVDGSKEYLDYGVLVEEYFPGRPFDYSDEADFEAVAKCLADIHSVPVPESSSLIEPGSPWDAMMEECEAMFRVYVESELSDSSVRDRIRRMMDRGYEMIQHIDEDIPYRCCINTELNNRNFIVEEHSDGSRFVRLIDWEKPLYTDPAQDLGHLLTPTTTFWKTDIFYDEETMDRFIDYYIDAVDGRFDTTGLRERTHRFITITCLRGITYCAMAWVKYQDPDKLIRDEYTEKKQAEYLTDWFLTMIERRFGV